MGSHLALGGKTYFAGFLWPQLAIILIATQMAYIGVLPWSLLDWPMSDKVLHFLLFGGIAFWLNIWLEDRKLHLNGYSVPIALVLPIFFAFLDESLQYFSLVRNADLLDLLSDIAGLTTFYFFEQEVSYRHLSWYLTGSWYKLSANRANL